MARRRLSRAWGAGAGAGAGAASEGVISRVAIRQESASTTVCNKELSICLKPTIFVVNPPGASCWAGHGGPTDPDLLGGPFIVPPLDSAPHSAPPPG